MVEKLPVLLNIFAQVLAPPLTQLKDNVRQELLDFLNTLKAHHTDQFQSLLTNLQGSYQTLLLDNLR